MNTQLTIVTGANSTYFNGLTNLLWSIATFAPWAQVVVYDLGLTEDQSKQVPNIRKFDFGKYPDYFNPSINSGRAAFRPVIVQSIAKEFGGIVLWLDGGCLLTHPIDVIVSYAKKHGVYCAPTRGTIEQGLYPSAIASLNASGSLLQLPMRDEGVSAFDTSNQAAMELLGRWATVALDNAITAPEGSIKKTHRQDAVFAVLLNQAGFNLDGYKTYCVAQKQQRVSLTEAKQRYERFKA